VRPGAADSCSRHKPPRSAGSKSGDPGGHTRAAGGAYRGARLPAGKGAPWHIISDQEGVFVSEVFTSLLRDWNIKQRFGAVGKHGSIAVTERAILTLKQEWLRRVPVIQGLDHLSQLLADFSEYYNHWRGHSAIGGAASSVIHRGEVWQRPDRSAKTLPGSIERRFLPDTRVTAFRLAA
jgi:transposase InsO family protein